MKNTNYDLIVIGAGAAGIMASIIAAREGKRVLLLEKLSQIAAKLKATGGGRCNLTNTLENSEFMQSFGRDGRFMQDALKLFDYKALIDFFQNIGVETHAPDGFRVFPTSHSSVTIISALQKELDLLGVETLLLSKVYNVVVSQNKVVGVETDKETLLSDSVVLATGGLGYPTLGAEGDGHAMAQKLGHKTTELFPAMTPLKTKENWVASCRADTIAKAQIRVDMKKHKKLKATGDLIFTKNGIRGPVVLDFARELTPLIDKYGEVPILINMTKGMNEEQIASHLKNESTLHPEKSVVELLNTLLPFALSNELCKLANVNPQERYSKIQGSHRAKLINITASTPLTLNGHDGFKMAMITRGGVSLKEIDPKTMQSKIIKGLYFCGEIMNLDGPCGGYNLQWSFASGALAGKLL